MENSDMIQSFCDALVNKDRSKVECLVKEHNSQELFTLLTSRWNNKAAICYLMGDAQSFSMLFNRIDAADRLKLLEHPYYPQPQPQPHGYSVLLHALLYKEECDPDSIVRELHKSLPEKDWKSLIDVSCDSSFLGCLGGHAPELSKVLQYVLESIDDPIDRIALLQDHDRYGRCLAQILVPCSQYLKAMISCLPEHLRLNFFQTTFHHEDHQNIFGKKIRLPDNEAVVSLASRYTIRKKTTLIHELTRYMRFGEAGFSINDSPPYKPWEKTDIFYVLNSVDKSERYDLLTTKDSDGNNPIHLFDAGAWPYLLGMLPPKDKSRPLFEQNNKGDTPLHQTIYNLASPGIRVKLIDFLSVEIMIGIMSIQNDQGNTILHSYLLSKDDCAPDIVIKLLNELNEQTTTKIDESFLLLINRENKNILHALLNSYQFDGLDERRYNQRVAYVAIVELLIAIKSRTLVHQLLIGKDHYGDSPIHTIARDYSMFVPQILKMNKEKMNELVYTKHKTGDTPIHTIAKYSPFKLPVVLEAIPSHDLPCILKEVNSLGDTTVHLLVKHVGYANKTRQVLKIVENRDVEEILRIENELGATPLHTALANNNHKAFDYMVEALGEANQSTDQLHGKRKSLEILGVIMESHVSDILSLVTENTVENAGSHLTKLTISECYYISQVLGLKANQDMEKHIEDQLKNIKKIVIDDFVSKPNIISKAVTSILEEKFQLGNTLLHILAERTEFAVIQKILHVMTLSQRNRLLSSRNHGGKTPLEVARSYKIKRLLEWSDSQQGFYYLQTPPVVLMMPITSDREEAHKEITQLELALPSFNVSVKKVLNPSKEEMLESIRKAGRTNEDISALIVIIMAHGIQGRVWSADGYEVQIQDILLEMQSALPDGKPKVLLVQACQDMDANIPSKIIAEHTKRDPAPPNSQRRKGSAAQARQTEQTPANTQLEPRSQLDYSLQWRDFITMVASVNGGTAYRNQMIPMFAQELKDSANNGDIYEIFLKTHYRLQKVVPDQVPEFRSTLTQKLSLRNIFTP